MKKLKRILMATAFGDTTQHVLDAVCHLGQRFGSQVLLVHVMPTREELPGELDYEAIRQTAVKHLNDLRKTIEGQGVVVAETVVAEGVPSEQVEQLAYAHAANVIVAGAVRNVPEGTVSLGTTADRLLRSSATPVWLIHPSREVGMRRIVCAVDCSVHSERALRNALHFARAFKSQLTILHVIEPLTSVYSGLLGVQAEEQVNYAKRQEEALDQFLIGYDFEDVEVEKKCVEGNAVEHILAASSDQCDLLIMGAAGRQKRLRVTMGRTVDKILHAMSCSVIIVKDENVIRLEFESEVQILQEQYERGLTMLKNGFSAEAVELFTAYVEQEPMAAGAWGALAEAHRRLGHKEQAKASDDKARYVRDTIWKRMVEADVRKQHTLWKGDKKT